MSELTRRSEVLRLLRLILPQPHLPAGVAETGVADVRIPSGVVEGVHVLHRLASQWQRIGIARQSAHGNASALSRALCGSPGTYLLIKFT